MIPSHFKKTIAMCKQVWNNWEQLRYVTHSPVIVDITIALLNLLRLCFVKVQNVRVYFLCSKRLFNLSAEATINLLNPRPRVRWAIFPLKNKQVRSSWSLAKGFTFLKRRKNHFKLSFEMRIVPHAQRKSAFTFQPTKITVSTTAKSAKLNLTCSRFLLNLKKDNIVVRGWYFTWFCKIDESGLRETKTICFWKTLTSKHNQAQPKLNQKKLKSIHLWHNRVDCLLVDPFYQNFPSISFFTLPVYSIAILFF